MYIRSIILIIFVLSVALVIIPLSVDAAASWEWIDRGGPPYQSTKCPNKDPKDHFLSLVSGKDPVQWTQVLNDNAIISGLSSCGIGQQRNSAGNVRGRLYLPHASCLDAAPGPNDLGVKNDPECWKHAVDVVQGTSNPGADTQSQTGSRTFSTPTKPSVPTQGLPGFGELVASIFTWSLNILGIVVFVQIFYAGFKWFTAAGNTASVNEARAQITNAITGALILLSAYIILYTLNPDLVGGTFTLPGVEGNKSSNNNSNTQNSSIETSSPTNLTTTNFGAMKSTSSGLQASTICFNTYDPDRNIRRVECFGDDGGGGGGGGGTGNTGDGGGRKGVEAGEYIRKTEQAEKAISRAVDAMKKNEACQDMFGGQATIATLLSLWPPIKTGDFEFKGIVPLYNLNATFNGQIDYNVLAASRTWRDIRLFAPFFERDEDEQALTILHELGHFIGKWHDGPVPGCYDNVSYNSAIIASCGLSVSLPSFDGKSCLE